MELNILQEKTALTTSRREWESTKALRWGWSSPGELTVGGRVAGEFRALQRSQEQITETGHNEPQVTELDFVLSSPWPSK